MTKVERDRLILQIINKLGCVARGMQALHKFEFGGQELSRPQVDILLRIADFPDGVVLKELAGYLNVSPGAISQFVDELVEKGLVVRTTSAQDRRVGVLTLANKFAKSKDKFVEAYLASVGDVFAQLSESEVARLQELLNKLNYKPGSCEMAKGGESNE